MADRRENISVTQGMLGIGVMAIGFLGWGIFSYFKKKEEDKKKSDALEQKALQGDPDAQLALKFIQGFDVDEYWFFTNSTQKGKDYFMSLAWIVKNLNKVSEYYYQFGKSRSGLLTIWTGNLLTDMSKIFSPTEYDKWYKIASGNRAGEVTAQQKESFKFQYADELRGTNPKSGYGIGAYLDPQKGVYLWLPDGFELNEPDKRLIYSNNSKYYRFTKIEYKGKTYQNLWVHENQLRKEYLYEF